MGEQRVDGAVVGGRPAQLEQRAADAGRGKRQRRLQGDGQAELAQDRGQQRAARVGAADDDYDLVRLVPRSEQACDLDPDRLRLAPGAGGLHQHEPVVGRDRWRAGLEQVAVQVAQHPALGMRLVERQLEHALGAELRRERPEQRRAHGERTPVLVVDRDRDLGRPRQPGEQLQLGAAEVVEPVDQHRAPVPRLRIAPQGGDRRFRHQPRVGVPARVAELHVARVEASELDLVRRVVELVDQGLELARRDQCRLQLGDQGVERRREAGPPGRAPERAGVGAADRRPHQGLSLRHREGGGELDRERPGHLSREGAEGRDRTAQRRPLSAAAKLALELGDVVPRGHDQHRLALERGAKPGEHLAGAARVRRSLDDLKPHRFQHRSRRGSEIGRGTPLVRHFRTSFCRPGADLSSPAMSLCFIDPADAVRAIADSIGREARRQLLGEAVRAWVEEIPDDELEAHYAKAISELDEHDISMLAAWHASMDVGTPIPNRDYLMGAFPSLGEHRREALKLAAGFRGEEAVDRGVTEERALETVLEWLSGPRLMGLAVEAVELYVWDRAGSDN